ncbi:MAG: SUMF1/EgtB/PvdO family nonheme iron enzyme [Cyanobacteria bacterium P01_E01_bin.6]
MAKNWAIAIGINQYELLPTSAHLRYAVRDAELMHNFLHQTAGFPADNILLCSDASPAIGRLATRPSRSILRRILREELQRARGADNLWFFFAGHGMAGRNGDYFLPIDGNPNDLEDTAVSVNFVTECLRRCEAKNVVLVLDMCRNEGRTDSRDISVNVGEQTIELAKQQGMITMFSCSRGERSYEIPELEQGAFTYCLVNGLKQHTILRQLEQYLIQEIPKLRQRYPYNIPIPRIIPEPGWKYDAPLLPGYATQSDVGQLIEQATNAELHEEFDRARQLWWQVVDVGTSIERAKARSALDRIRNKELNRGQVMPPPTLPLGQPPFQAEPRDVSDTQVSSVSSSAPPSSLENSSFLQTFSFETAKITGIRKTGGVLGIGGQTVCDVKRESLTAKGFVERFGNGIALEMVQILAGRFWMGQTDAEKEELIRQIGEENYQRWYACEMPRHPVTVSSFSMGKFPVTQAQYAAVMGNNPATECDDKFVAPNKPVVGVSWEDAVAFCQKLSEQTGREYRLPSEAEWEYACRANTTTPFHFGDTITTDLANYRGTDLEFSGTTYPGNYGSGPKGEFREETTPVGSFPANAFGLFDMHGNVWEWCADHWHEDYQNAPTDGRAWIEGGNSEYRMIRGGSWFYPPLSCRSARRIWYSPGIRYYLIGFRVVSVLAQDS